MKKISIVSFGAIVALLIASCGSNTSQPDNQPGTPTPLSGETIYKNNCIACHQANGEGMPGSFPPLAKSDYLGDKGKAIAAVIKGVSGEMTVNGTKYSSVMPAQPLTDDEAAAVLTYVYSGFGNTGAAVTRADVKAAR